MTTPRQSLGKWGESQAADYLSQVGYTILERNARTPYGELHLVCLRASSENEPIGGQDLVIVFIEVKTRSSAVFGPPESSVTPRKQERLRYAAQSYLQDHPELDKSWRIDVIAIERFRRNEIPVIHHFENAVRD